MAKTAKRMIILFITAILVLSLFGCKPKSRDSGGEGTTDDSPVTLRIANWSSAGAALERAGVECFTRAFTEKYSNVSFEVDILDDYANQFQNNMAAGSNKYDVFLVPDGYFGSWVNTGVMLDLTDRVRESEVIDIDKIYANVVDRYMYDGSTYSLGKGKIYALPKDVGPYVMYYNKDLLRELTVDGTSIYDKYEEFLTATESFDIQTAHRMWKDIKAADNTLYAVGNVQIEGLVWSNGADFIDASKTPAVSTLTDPKVEEAYQLYLDMFREGLMPDGATASTADPSTLFMAGTCATLITGRWAVTSYRTIGDFEWDVCPVPSFSANPTLNSSSGSVGFAVHKNSQNQYWAWKFVEYCASLEGQIAGTKAGFCIPFYDTEEAVAALKQVDAGKLPANTDAFVNAAKSQHKNRMSYLPYSFRWVARIDTLSGYIFLQEKDTGYQTISQFLAQAHNEVNSILRVDWDDYTF